MIVENKGFRIDDFFIPPFVLNKGEIFVLYLYGGAHFDNLKTQLVNIFSGVTKNENVILHQKLSYVEHYNESVLRKIFNPITVSEFINKNAVSNNEIIKDIYQKISISPKFKMNRLDFNVLKNLYILITFSKNKNIIFDLNGQGPVGAKYTYELVKENIGLNGSAILLDWTD